MPAALRRLPKGAIIFAIVLTFAWVTLLVWAFNRMLDLF